MMTRWPRKACSVGTVMVMNKIGRRFCLANLDRDTTQKVPPIRMRSSNKISEDVLKIKSDYSNISGSILDLADRRLYKVKNHPLATLAEL